MKKTFVYRYEIMGTAYGWPIDVYISKNERSGSWTVYFHQAESGHTGVESFSADDAAGFEWIAGEKGINLQAFSSALSNSQHKDLVQLGHELQQIAK